jgi:hypothetical protein
MRNLVFTSLFALIEFSALGQHAGYQPVADLAGFKKQFAVEAKKINAISSNFSQEKTLTALTETIISTGVFQFRTKLSQAQSISNQINFSNR